MKFFTPDVMFKIVSFLFNKYIFWIKISISSMLICTNKSSLNSYHGMRTIHLQYIQFNFHLHQDILQKLSKSKSSVMVSGKCEWIKYIPYGVGRNNTDASKLLHRRFQQKIWIIISFFSRRDRDFYNLVVRDEIEICIFYISRFETRSRICSVKSWISRRGREIKKDFSWSSENSRC